MKRYITVAVLMAGFFSTSFGQERLTLDDAISIALENNYGILVARNDAQISANNAHPGAAGLLPTVSGNAGANYNNNNVQVEFATTAIPSVDESGVVSSSMNAGINLNYTVFDGLGNVNTFRVLKKSAQLSETQVQAVIEATISQVGIAYYAIARLTENYQTLQESAEISQERLSRANNQKAFGTAGKLVVLNAEVDLNSDSSNIAVASFSLENAKRNLNALIGRDVNSDFSVDTEVSFARNLNLNNLMATAQKNNVTLRQAEYLQQIAELNLRIAKANYMPVLGVSAGYNYSRAENGPGSILKSQQSLGLTLGASLNIPLFAGNQRKVLVQNAEINLLNSRHQQNEVLLELERDLSNAYYTFQSTLRQLDLDQKSLESAQENFDRTNDAFKLGQANSVQFREAQLNLLRVRNRINDLRFTAKLNEIEILRLSGQLIGEK